MCVRARVCVRVRACVCLRASAHMNTYIYFVLQNRYIYYCCLKTDTYSVTKNVTDGEIAEKCYNVVFKWFYPYLTDCEAKKRYKMVFL